MSRSYRCSIQCEIKVHNKAYQCIRETSKFEAYALFKAQANRKLSTLRYILLLTVGFG